MDFKLDKGVGYMYCYNPTHPLANKSGKVYEHRYVMSNYLGRWLTTDEVVHHKDGDRTNNQIENLELTNNRDHAILHAIENGCIYATKVCKYCNKEFKVVGSKEFNSRKFCSVLCDKLSRRKFEVQQDILEDLLWKYPITHIAKSFGVSDKAVANRAKKMGLSKPPLGYWSKKRSSRNSN
jgi:endonuclease